MTPKAQSVDEGGTPDGFQAPLQFTPERAPDGTTRLKISAPVQKQPRIVEALARMLGERLGLLYVQLTDRAKGQHHSERPRRFITMERPKSELLDVLHDHRALIFEDARGQFWLRGSLGEQLIVDELGMIYVYPDDPTFRDALRACGVQEGKAQTLAERDYIKVFFQASADLQERELLQRLSMTEWTEGQ